MDNEKSGRWLPLLEYAVCKGMSVSTLRRRIKANKIQYELREGKYFLWDDGSFPLEDSNKVVQDLKEEIADLKTYIQYLENNQN
ncbi:MAG: hypothetical protein A3B70_01170 [Deltaproteobacteria bacterium RIFCSPHIGHO2_02_FULL_40_11]|nr:MAG: hypothetical protein A3B70_01170 [Deltaproteobacteria bacterium RIFCSPHIGHO2_02_FULL_40_11]